MGGHRDESSDRLIEVRDSAVERAVTTAHPEPALALAGALETARLRELTLGPAALPALATFVAALQSDTEPEAGGGDATGDEIGARRRSRDPVLTGAAVAAREFDLTTAEAARLAGCPPGIMSRVRTRLAEDLDEPGHRV